MIFVFIAIAGFWADLQNALAGGGSFVTLPVLMASGMSPLAANITSALALFPGQVSSGLAGRTMVSGAGALSFRALFGISIAGGITGALLLLNTPSLVFTALLPWLVLFATAVFAWGSFRQKPAAPQTHWSARSAGMAQLVIAIYGGYFGGGIGFLMLAALAFAGLSARSAGATKNALAAAMNASAVALLASSPDAHWPEAFALGLGAIGGGLCGTWALRRVNEKLLRALIVAIGVALTIGLFARSF